MRRYNRKDYDQHQCSSMNSGNKIATMEDKYEISESETGSGSSRAAVMPRKGGEWEEEEDGPCQGCCSPVNAPWGVVWRLALCTLAGIVFGWAMEKSRVFEPASIRGQMVFTRWIMLKMFLAAMGTGQLMLSLASVLPGLRDKVSGAMEAFAGCLQEKGLLTSALGPFILGAGMTLSGACPGMVLPQVGSWTKNSIFTLLGVLLGALIYGMVAPLVISISKPKKPFQIHTVHEWLKLRYLYIALPMSVLIGVTVFLMEWFIPWQDDLEPVNVNNNETSNVFLLKSWPPAVGGVLIGLLQVVIVIAVGDTLGGSTSYMTVVSQWVVGDKLKSVFPGLAKYRCGIGNWWQVFYVCAAMLGGCLSALSSDSLGTTKGVSIPSAVCGGILLLLGARFASGCTSGHGLSGAALLYWMSLLAVPCMFAGGIATGFAMQATGALDDYHCHTTSPC